MSRQVVVTGAFSNTGAAVAHELQRRGWTVRTLTNRPAPHGSTIRSAPLQFNDPAAIARFVSGADAFVNTYWIRFPHEDVNFDTAVANSRLLVEVARRVGVRRFVQVSVSNASLDSPLAYYRGKAEVDDVVRASGMSHAIVRPTLVVGPRDVLSNNIAWFLRRSPIFAVPAGAPHHLQPVLLDDLGRILADALLDVGDHALDIDAAGPVVYSFEEYVRALARGLGVRRAFVKLPSGVVRAMLRAVDPIVRDTVLTREELLGLRGDLLVSHRPPTGAGDVAVWLRHHAREFGRQWNNDTRDRFARRAGTMVT